MKFLLVADNPGDGLLVARQVRQEFPDVELAEAHSSDALDRALATGDVALVLIAYALAWTTGLEALDRVKAAAPDCPAIMISGTAGEDVAVEAMRRGSDDYLLMNQTQIERLRPAIHAALARAQDRKARREAEIRYRDLFELVPASLCQCSIGGLIMETNRSFRELFGVEADPSGARLPDFLADPSEFEDKIRQAETRLGTEVRLRRGTGEEIWALMRVRRVQGGGTQHLECAFTDITERKRVQERTEALLREKNALIEELYHRVNNNLQIVMSFVQQLFRETTDPTAKAGLQDLGARIYSLALVQDQLYRNENFAEVDLAQYLNELCAARLRGTSIALNLDTVGLRLPIAQAIPVGLIANELLLNAVQHAFPGVAEPRITVSLRRLPGGRAVLSVADNGRGMPSEPPPQGYGFRLVTVLARQIGAEVSLNTRAGTTVSVTFPAPG